jgi:hypothetical protein
MPAGQAIYRSKERQRIETHRIGTHCLAAVHRDYFSARGIRARPNPLRCTKRPHVATRKAGKRACTSIEQRRKPLILVVFAAPPQLA